MIDPLLKAVAAGNAQPVYLIHGDLVLAEPAALRLAEALASRSGCAVDVRRHPARLAPLLDDLRTFSLFSTAKVVLVTDSAALADRAAAADLIDEAEAALPVGEGDLPMRAREGAGRLLQALHLFGLDARRGAPATILAELPRWVLEGGHAVRQRKPRGRNAKEIEALTTGLTELLEAALGAGIEGWAEGDLAELAAAIDGGFPPGHTLVLAERNVAADHPVVATLAERGAVVELGSVSSEKGGAWSGLEGMVRQLEEETGAKIARDALAELAKRTLRSEREGAAEADSTARLAGEYRKLATLAGGRGGRIERRMVEDNVEDRGQEDVWQILDAVGAGKGGEAIGRLTRYLAGAEDPLAARLSFFALLAGFCRQLVAIRGLLRVARVPAGDANYNRFKTQHAPALQAELPGGFKSPVAGLHPYRLHRAYLAASRIAEPEIATLPAAVLETELRLKGGTQDPDAALAALIGRLSRGR